VEGSKAERLEDEHVERPLKEIGFSFGHRAPPIDLTSPDA
jgi:hypothetical protein